MMKMHAFLLREIQVHIKSLFLLNIVLNILAHKKGKKSIKTKSLKLI